jgi:hypothetical protein
MEIKGENVGVDLHWLGHQDQVHLPRPDRRRFPIFWVVPPATQCLYVARESKFTVSSNEHEIGSDPRVTAAVGRLHYLHLYSTEVLGRTPSPVPPPDHVLHQAPSRRSLLPWRRRRLRIEYDNRPYGIFYLSLKSNFCSIFITQTLSQTQLAANSSRSHKPKIQHIHERDQNLQLISSESGAWII